MKRIALACLAALMIFGSVAAETTRLCVIGNYIPYPEFEAYMEAHPDVEIEYYGTDTSMELVEAVLTQTDVADMYALSPSIGHGFVALRDRGFLEPIADGELLRFARSLEPGLQPGLEHEGQICAIPFDAIVQRSIFFDPVSWKGMGLTEEQLPGSWTQLFRFLAEDWPELAEEHPEISAFMGSIDAERLLDTVQQNYHNYHAAKGDLSFDTDEYRAMLEAFARVDWDSACLKNAETAHSGLFMLFKASPEAVEGIEYLPLAFTEGGDDVCIRATLPSMAVNPRSKNKEAAYDLMRYIVRNLDPLVKITICPEEREPVVHAENWAKYEEGLKGLEAYSARIEAEQDPAARTALELERDAYYRDKVEFYEDSRYLATSESIAKYHETVKGRMICAFDTAISPEEYEILEKKREQFIEGSVSVDAYVNELQRRYVFSLREGG